MSEETKDTRRFYAEELMVRDRNESLLDWIADCPTKRKAKLVANALNIYHRKVRRSPRPAEKKENQYGNTTSNP